MVKGRIVSKIILAAVLIGGLWSMNYYAGQHSTLDMTISSVGVIALLIANYLIWFKK